jgi:hypothetical protein
LDNSHLKISASQNYHHFFPKNYLQQNCKEKEPNLVANITLIDGYSNKHRIGKKAPSDYISTFAKGNPIISDTLKTHLIKDMTSYGVTTDDYDTFVIRRSKAIAAALNVKLLSMSVDQAEQLESQIDPVAVNT